MDLNKILLDDAFLFTTFLKLFGLILSLMYIILAIVVIRQVGILRKTIGLNDQGVLTVVALIQLILGISLFTYSLLFL